jgi:hypothetical protein
LAKIFDLVRKEVVGSRQRNWHITYPVEECCGALMDTKVVAKQKVANYMNICMATLALHFHHFIRKELSDCPVDAIRMAVSFLYIYVDINLKILKYT